MFSETILLSSFSQPLKNQVGIDFMYYFLNLGISKLINKLFKSQIAKLSKKVLKISN